MCEIIYNIYSHRQNHFIVLFSKHTFHENEIINNISKSACIISVKYSHLVAEILVSFQCVSMYNADTLLYIKHLTGQVL